MAKVCPRLDLGEILESQRFDVGEVSESQGTSPTSQGTSRSWGAADVEGRERDNREKGSNRDYISDPIKIF